jgi:DNA invertase Pin-like site-specific DNA recombinase
VKAVREEDCPTGKAIGYMRTSSAANVGTDKDCERRQRAAIQSYADRAGIEVVSWHYDPAVSGADHVASRPGFQAMLQQKFLAINCHYQDHRTR